LGATLYELLTLRPAFPGQDRQDLLRRIVHEEPPPPRQHAPAVPRDLETVVLKAMTKEVPARYDRAQDLADDLRRFLACEPVRARRPTLGQWLAKLLQRHRLLVRWVAALLAVAVLCLVAAFVVVLQALESETKALGEKTRALEEKDRALKQKE